MLARRSGRRSDWQRLARPRCAAAGLTAAAVAAALTAGCEPRPEPPGTGSTPGVAPAAAPAAEVSTTADEAALRELSERWMRGLRAGDADTAASVYSVQAEVFLPGAPELLLGQDAVREHLAGWLAERRVLGLDVRRSAFVVRPEVAYSLGVWQAVTAPARGGAPDTAAGHLTDVYRRDGSGPWVVAHEHVSLVQPGTETPDSVPF